MNRSFIDRKDHDHDPYKCQQNDELTLERTKNKKFLILFHNFNTVFSLSGRNYISPADERDAISLIFIMQMSVGTHSSR
jgi:hypothetical protein